MRAYLSKADPKTQERRTEAEEVRS
jgi:hypothetical protein